MVIDESMEQAMQQAAAAAENSTWTRSRSVALGQQPGPPLATPRRANNNNNLQPLEEEEIDGTPLETDEVEELLEDAALVLQGSLIGSDVDDETSWQPPAEKGKGRAHSQTSPTPSFDQSVDRSPARARGPKAQEPAHDDPKIPTWGGERLQDILRGGETPRTLLDGGSQKPDKLRKPTLLLLTGDLNARVNRLFAEGRHAEANGILEYFDRQTARSVIGTDGVRVPAAGGSGLPDSCPYTLVQEELSASENSVGNVPHVPPAYTSQQSRLGPVHTAHPQVQPAYSMPSRVQGEIYQTRIPPTTHPEPQLATLPLPSPFLTQEDVDEAEQVKVLLATRKGRLVLRNGDVVENGRLLVADSSEKMEKGLPQLSPVLRHWLRTFKSRRKAPSESKVDDGSASLRVYGGQPPPDEYTMQFEEWIDGISLFIKYVADAGWITLAERFEGHRRVVMDLRDNFGWMIALRYCILIRQGVMQETIDNRIRNFSTLQSTILEYAKLQADTLQERAYRTNPYALGGPLAHQNPLTGLPKSTTAHSKKSNLETAYSRIGAQATTSPAATSQGAWISSQKWRTMSTEEKHAATAARDPNTSYRRREGDRGREREPYRERERDRTSGRDRYSRDDRPRYRRRSKSRSRSPRGTKGKGRGSRHWRAHVPVVPVAEPPSPLLSTSS
ncbi:uncharacterized protein MELLADRAFT_95217 [Melampsora larici-populina 98AG31]|uniref:Uncharacterized protein n=1 Tax=Melampsora larici-populina (strain 98AG31 / pathotype 3-4-7) TaxID=747676 RepID=F4RCJ8_MELLP|nr:uncharacterized protein MELLADRAFT_95217 [Melampsora larici-populina 98AG31]EGG09748.1 hypothetical protein MELLADRAFT_95217 [Melampsora larici-populina 98AG31]